jgi:hypothetical protein
VLGKTATIVNRVEHPSSGERVKCASEYKDHTETRMATSATTTAHEGRHGR